MFFSYIEIVIGPKEVDRSKVSIQYIKFYYYGKTIEGIKVIMKKIHQSFKLRQETVFRDVSDDFKPSINNGK